MKAATALLSLLCIGSFISLVSAADGVSSSLTNEDERLRRYWTLARQFDAIPRDVITLDGSPSTEQETAEKLNYLIKDISPVFETGRDSIYFPSDDEDTQRLSDEFGSYALSYTAYPWRTIGKVYFTSGGVDYVCTGAVIRPNVIATAGHCVYDTTHGWVKTFTFIPGMSAGDYYYGKYSYYQMFTSTEWVTRGDLSKDYGFVVLHKSKNESVGNYVGYFGYSYNTGYGLTWRALSYAPESDGFVGYNFFTDSTEQGTDKPKDSPVRNHRILSNITMAGGPWVSQFGTNNYINSVFTYKYKDDPKYVYGTYFDDSWYDVLAAASAVDAPNNKPPPPPPAKKPTTPSPPSDSPPTQEKDVPPPSAQDKDVPPPSTQDSKDNAQPVPVADNNPPCTHQDNTQPIPQDTTPSISNPPSTD